jgi:hypothetical protein
LTGVESFLLGNEVDESQAVIGGKGGAGGGPFLLFLNVSSSGSKIKDCKFVTEASRGGGGGAGGIDDKDD